MIRNSSPIALLIRGADLPVANLANAFTIKPIVIRDKFRKQLCGLENVGAAYCCFNFNAEQEFPASLERLLNQVSKELIELRRMATIDQITFHVPIYAELDWMAKISPQLIRKLAAMDVYLWLDFYFDASDLVLPPGSLVASAPADTQWYGGLVDSICVFWGMSDAYNSCREVLPAAPSHVNCRSQLSFEERLAGISKDQRPISSDALFCILISERANRSFELSPAELITLRNLEVSLIICSVYKMYLK